MDKSLSFKEKLKEKWQQGLFVCVGLDCADFNLNKSIIDQTADLVCCYKPNVAFYFSEGLEGVKALEDTANYIHRNYPDIVVLIDAKIADVDNTNAAYAKAMFEWLNADAVTVNPYPGKEAFKPFLDKEDKGVFVWIKPSNKGTSKLQDIYQTIAEDIAKNWNTNGNCGVVVGATYPEELKAVREIVGDMPILIPGIGAQGGNVKETVQAGINSQGNGIIISSSRSIIFSDNPREATLKLHQQIQEALNYG